MRDYQWRRRWCTSLEKRAAHKLLSRLMDNINYDHLLQRANCFELSKQDIRYIIIIGIFIDQAKPIQFRIWVSFRNIFSD